MKRSEKLLYDVIAANGGPLNHANAVQHAASECLSAHAFLDEMGLPIAATDISETYRELSLVGRIQALMRRLRKQRNET